jgi:hypothetical protein
MDGGGRIHRGDPADQNLPIELQSSAEKSHDIPRPRAVDRTFRRKNEHAFDQPAMPN